MPRKVFGNLEEFKRWIEEVATPERFVFCITEEGEIIAEPTKSTRPLTYAYIRITDAKKVEEMEKMLKEAGFQVWKLKAYEWDTEKAVGVKVRVEEEA
ncbi:MAG: hypothetical protein ACTSVR_09515 [Candidatus Thorarchaeota archaeon]